MATPVILTGFEHGNLSVNGAGIVNTISGTAAAIASDQAHSGTYSLKMNASAATGYIAWTLSTPTVFVTRFYIRFSAFNTGTKSFADVRVTAGNVALFRVASTGVTSAGWNTGTFQTGPTLSLDTWYQVDFRADQGAGTKTIDWRVAGSAQTQATIVEAASTFTSVRFGLESSDTCTLWIDDVFISTTTADYPIGDSTIVGLSPNADGTHNAGTNVMEDASLNDIGAVTAWNLLDDVPMGSATTTDRVQQTATGTGNYAEVAFTNMPSASAINGVIARLCYQSSGTTTNEGATIVSHDGFGTFNDVFGNPTTRGNMSETSDFFKSVIVTPPGGGWTESAVNALLMRIGYSGNVATIPYWLALMIEVDYVAGAAAGLPFKPTIISQAVNRASTY